nr:hypothetical protein [Pseudomonas ficuserectae]
MKINLISLCLLLALTACSKKDDEMPSKSQIDFAYERLKFQCSHESDVLQKPNEKSDILYKYALFLEKQKKEKTTIRLQDFIVFPPHMIITNQLPTYKTCFQAVAQNHQTPEKKRLT